MEVLLDCAAKKALGWGHMGQGLTVVTSSPEPTTELTE